MATPDRSRTTSYQSTIVGIYQPCTILEICDVTLKSTDPG